jgi:hypothetical protein
VWNELSIRQWEKRYRGEPAQHAFRKVEILSTEVMGKRVGNADWY